MIDRRIEKNEFAARCGISYRTLSTVQAEIEPPLDVEWRDRRLFLLARDVSRVKDFRKKSQAARRSNRKGKA